MPASRETVIDFWRRLTEGRGAPGGAVRFHEPVEDLLDDWKGRVWEELTALLRDFEGVAVGPPPNAPARV